MKFYVTMTDRFMSGWGMAEGKINKLVIECDSREQAELIEREAHRREEMKYINVNINKPRYPSNRYYVSHRTAAEMPAWIQGGKTND